MNHGLDCFEYSLLICEENEIDCNAFNYGIIIRGITVKRFRKNPVE